MLCKGHYLNSFSEGLTLVISQTSSHEAIDAGQS